jgi:hypothetical protein
MSQRSKGRFPETQLPGTAAGLAPPDYCDPVIEAYKKDVDRSLLRENLKLTVQERFEKFERFMEYVYEMQAAGRKAREQVESWDRTSANSSQS